MDSFGLCILLVVLISFSAFFSATETAFSSLNLIRIKSLSNAGNKKATLVEKLIAEYDKLLSTILIGNNVVNILSSSIATVLFVEYFGNAGVTIATIVMTVLILVFGEISPKSLAKEHAEGVALSTGKALVFFEVLLSPFTFLFGQWKKLLSRVFGSSNARSITEEELITFVDEVESGGEINSEESDLIKSAIEFNDLVASDILKPRIDVLAFELGTPTDEIIDMFISSGYSRLPVYRDTIDNIIGVVHQKDLFGSYYKDKDVSIESILTPVKFVSPSMEISELFRVLQKTKNHFVVVTDEYGGTDGIITLEDIIEELLGEIWDEHDKVVENIIKISDTHYKILGSSDLEDLFDLIGEEDKDDDPNTVAGWVMEKLEKIPEEGDSFEFNNYKFSVTKMDSTRVTEVELIKLRNDDDKNEDK